MSASGSRVQFVASRMDCHIFVMSVMICSSLAVVHTPADRATTGTFGWFANPYRSRLESPHIMVRSASSVIPRTACRFRRSLRFSGWRLAAANCS